MSNRALTPLPTALKPRRRRIRQTRCHARRKQRQLKGEHDALLDELPCDTLVALRTLRQDWPHEATTALPRTPPILLDTQLDALLVDSVTTRLELGALTEREIRPIKMPSGGVCYIMDEDYYRTDDQFAKVLREIRNTWVPRDVVENAVGEDGASKLVRQGYLTMRNEDSFFFAVPCMGAFLREREKGNNKVLSILRKEPYTEMAVEKLEGRTLPDTCFTARWHVRDIVGGGGAEAIDTTVGVIIRLKR